jgi:hypothetical protein
MNPLELKIQDLQRQIDEIKRFEGLGMIESAKTRLSIGGGIVAGSTSAPTTINQSVGASQAFTAPFEYDNRLLITVNGVDYYIGIYTA